MKKAFRIFLFIALFIILLMSIAGFLISSRGIPSYKIQTISHKVQSTEESTTRGKKLALMLCANCHRNNETGKLTGGRMIETPREFGEIYAPNITQDSVHGIGRWTDGELIYLLRTGIKKNGKYAPPYMAKLPKMADSDIDAIISFLKSDNEMVLADPTPDTLSKPSFLTKLLCIFSFKPLPMPAAPISLPDSVDALLTGKYLAESLECFSCHSADFKTNDFINPELSKRYFGGGNHVLNKKRQKLVTANLTPDMETGIGSWSKEKFIRALKYGIKEGENSLRYPMIPYVQLTDFEAGAIFEYLQTIPPIKNEVPRTVLDNEDQ